MNIDSLKPDKTIQKILISSPCCFIGEFETSDILLTHVFPNTRDIKYKKMKNKTGTVCIFSFRVDFDEKNLELLNYTAVGSMICAYLSVLYGKRFDNCGLVEGSGIFYIPDLSSYNQLFNNSLPFNSNIPRKNLEIPLNLGEFSRLIPLLNGSLSNKIKFIRTLQSASKFYLQALQIYENDVEVAYLHLITAIEILSNFYEYNKDELFDNDLKKTLEIIQKDSGEKIVKFIKNRLFQVKKQFTKTICDLINDNFFIGTDSKRSDFILTTDNFNKRIAAAYDLRSQYVHSGISFGKQVSWLLEAEIVAGTPNVENKEYQKILSQAPTFIGLERITRYCLLRFIHLNGVKLSPLLD
jgi:hypothetical protein